MQCKCSRTSYVLAARCATLVALVIALPVHAQQFVLVDQTYTANQDNTQDSHFTAELKPGIPTDLRAPINYANGSVHVALEMIESPSATDGLYNICLENSSDVACLPYVPYKGKGKYEDNPKFSTFWQNEKVDWTKGVSKVSLIIKDKSEGKAQGSTTFYPYTAHVILTVVAEGSTFDPNAADSSATGQAGRAAAAAGGGGSGSGKGGSGGTAGSSSSNQGGAGGTSAKAGSAGASTGSGGAVASAANSGAGAVARASTGGTGGAAKPAQTPTTGSTAGTASSRVGVSSGAAGSDTGQSVSSQLEDTSGCSVSRVGSRAAMSAWPVIALGWLAARTRKRKTARAA
jgi:hypothetical protein